MRKSLSLNNRPRSTSRSQKSEGRSSNQGFRSISSVYAAKAATLTRTRAPEDQIKAIHKNIKKLQKRIAKAKVFLAVPQSKETEAHAQMREKLVKWEGLVNKHIFTLQFMQLESEPAKKREVSKHQVRQAIENGEFVRLNDGKLVPRKGGYIEPVKNLSLKRKQAEEEFQKLMTDRKDQS